MRWHALACGTSCIRCRISCLSPIKDTCLAACHQSPDITELLPFEEAVNAQLGMLMLEGFLLVIDCHSHSPVGIVTPWLVLVDLYQD